MRDSFRKLERELVRCRRCQRLVAWRERAASEAPRSLQGAEYWSRPVPGFGDERARILVLGLAPGAHGANRTGRPFTGDASGSLVYGALHRAGSASRAVSKARDDGLVLADARITNAARCAPPGNRPTAEELANCFPYLVRELALLRETRVILCLGGIAWAAALALARAWGAELPRPKPRFAHGAELDLGASFPLVLASYHPSRQNTNTGRLTRAMFDALVRRAVARSVSGSSPPRVRTVPHHSVLDSR